MRKRIVNVIIESLKEVYTTFEDLEFEEPTSDTQIFGFQGQLDSLGLVTLIVIIEGKILKELDRGVVIASEKAISQSSSPFKSVQSLAGYIENIMKEEK